MLSVKGEQYEKNNYVRFLKKTKKKKECILKKKKKGSGGI